MKYNTLEDALRSIRDDDLFVNGIKSVYLKDDADKEIVKGIIEANEGLSSDELSILVIEMTHSKDGNKNSPV